MAQEIRQKIVREKIPELIKALTGFDLENDAENIKRCELFTFYTFKNHRNLSVNSHAIKREIEIMEEKFRIGNYKVYGDHLVSTCDQLVHNPICLNHYEVDVAWSILEFLFNMAYNPVGSFRNNKHKINLNLNQLDEETTENISDPLIDDLKEDYLEIECYNDDDSELSEWSDTDEAIIEDNKSEEVQFNKTMCNYATKIKDLEPPKKQNHFKFFDATNSEQWLLQNVQNRWWCNPTSQCFVRSNRLEAEFAHLWKMASEKNLKVKFADISTETEYNLLREIIWMFNSLEKCKFFNVSETGTITAAKNVSISSISVKGLQSYLTDTFIPYINMYNVLQKFINSNYMVDDVVPPKTYECYAANLKHLLSPFLTKLLNLENQIKQQRSLNTIVQLKISLRDDFTYLEQIYKIHSAIVLNSRKHDSHILSAYLLAGLFNGFKMSHTLQESNIVTALFLSSVKVFCSIIDIWWSEGRLDDWQNEYLFEREKNLSENVSIRQFIKNEKTGKVVPNSITSIITNDDFLNLLIDHSLEAGRTLNLLYAINKIGDMRKASNFKGSLYDTFLEDVMNTIKKCEFQSSPKIHQEDNEDSDSKHNNSEKVNKSDDTLKQLLVNCSDNTDKFLLMAFGCNIPELDENETLDEYNSESTAWNALKIFEKLSGHFSVAIPFDEIILASMSKILQNRISFVNQFVMKLFREEFKIKTHLRNIRKILLLESSDLTNSFFSKLFEQIQSGKVWAIPFQLTIQLDDILCSRHPEMSSLFRVEIISSFRCQTTKVTEAVDEITIVYSLSHELEHIINPVDMITYNKIFRFLLKVKWGLWALDNLKFPHSYKKRSPFTKYEMIDLLMRRFAQLRFWMMFSVHCIHSHLVTQVLESMGKLLDSKVENSTNLTELKNVHKSYIHSITEHCFLTDGNFDIKFGIEQLLNLAHILCLEWNTCVREIENNSGPLAYLDENIPSSVVTSSIEAIELTYIRCHQFLAKTLNNEVYVKQNAMLDGLSAAFNTSIPY